MKATILDGKQLAQTIKDEIRAEVHDMTMAGLRPPHLTAILVGNDPASKIYVRNKMQSCDYVGFSSTLKRLPAAITEEKLLSKIDQYNEDEDIDGILVQMPLPEHITPQHITLHISSEKDVDGFHPSNVGLMTLDYPSLIPATPYGIVELLKRYNISPKGKHCVVIGKSRIVGRPISILLSGDGPVGEGTVTVCHIHTPPEMLKAMTQTADIIVVAAGKPKLVTADMVKDDVVVIDVGINRIPAPEKKSGYRLVGDVDFEAVAEKASFITPVPGGVGPMTIAMLLKNTLEAYKARSEK